MLFPLNILFKNERATLNE